MEITRHFTATTFIVCDRKVLLHFHMKLARWLPVGGHIDRDEIPEEAALREVKEETGLDVRLIDGEERRSFEDVRELNRPFKLLLEDINEYHQHMDFIYIAESETTDLTPGDGETEEMRWLTAEELEDPEIPEDVRVLALEALEIVSGG